MSLEKKRIFNRFEVDEEANLIRADEKIPVKLVELSLMSCVLESEHKLEENDSFHIQAEFLAAPVAGKIVRAQTLDQLCQCVFLFEDMDDVSIERLFARLNAEIELRENG